ncbi:class I SAM-dependent methyltransferase [Rubripirellula amarantea]|nr:class I SAM-dependent methyltransferase [Rubripirellula amarantea]
MKSASIFRLLFLVLFLGIEVLVCGISLGQDVDVNTSVNPGINDSFLDPALEIESWLEKFEVESREVYRARESILAAMGIKQGDHVADIGAGTGFFSLMMNEAVGKGGWCYSVELSPKFAQHLTKLFADKKIDNSTTVLCRDDSVCLPPNSIDFAFICDVYHHFEFPHSTMQSIHQALKQGGRVVVIDFERIEGESREWTMGHVRAGKQTFIDEISEAGFELTAERTINGFDENYFLEFRKRPMTGSGN